ncbi:PAS domain S-box protein [Fulvivirga sp. M361]|uniref:PAS domain S-box protein n=1 Tax=Fulvivirga sp. M361 TaxID=2594266 RepID=UPI001627E398|nr:PAS domain S-box protein [Fulvivirga sp. M361]
MDYTEQVKTFFNKIYSKSNKVIEVLLIGYFLFGIFLSFFYDTYFVGISVGLLNLTLYFSAKAFFKGSRINQYIASLVAGIFMAQFIYQMHGMFEMHFTAFIAIIALITYQNKYAFLPQLIFVLIHHSVFAYIQYIGVVNENEAYQQIYFTQLEYMDLTTFSFHVGLYGIGIVLAISYTHILENNTTQNAESIIKLREMEERMLDNIQFANNIAEGSYETAYEPNEDDKMGSALLNMRDNLKYSTEREGQEKFINVGIAEISEIIRKYSENLDDLSFNVISYLSKYLKVNQGGIFILMDDGEEKYLELKGCYAYNRKKFAEKRVAIGQGLVGQCYIEKSIIRLKEIPQDYISITSGLGESTPSNLIIVPIMNDQIIEGVMELASFRDFNEYEIEFLNKVSKSIAAIITSAKVNERTKVLYEQSREQAEIMKSQEEEMRQNMEELSATQEEMERKSSEFESRFNALNESGIGSIEFDITGTIIDANDSFCDLMKYSKEELKGYHHKIFVDPEYSKSKEYQKFWKDLANGIAYKGELVRYTKLGKLIHLYGTYKVLYDRSGKPNAVLKFVFDITPYVKGNESSQQKGKLADSVS